MGAITEIERLRAANPVPVRPALGAEPVAQAALQRILAEPDPTSRRGESGGRRRRRLPHRGLGIVLALVLMSGGAAFAATDPFGWWTSQPGEADFAIDVAHTVATPHAAFIRCARADGSLRCTAAEQVCGEAGCTVSGHGLGYEQLEVISAPDTTMLSRRAIAAAITRAVRAHTMTTAEAERFRADLAAVPDSFFTEFALAMRYQTVASATGGGDETERVPPPGVPDLIACGRAGGAVTCRSLNGDLGVPIGAAVYAAMPGRGWRTVKTPATVGGTLPPGIHFTAAEYRLLADNLEAAASEGGTMSTYQGRTTTATVAGSTSPTGAPAP